MQNNNSFYSFNSLLKRRLLQRLAEHIVHLVVAEGLLEVGDGGVLVDADVLDVEHFGEVVPVLLVDVVRECAVVCAAGEYPRCCAYLEVGLRYPQCRCNGKFGQRFGFDAFYFLRDEAETVAEVNHCCLDAEAGL